MSQQYINIGATPNDGLGDPIYTAFQKTNENFSELYANSGNGGGNVNTGNITFSDTTISTANNNNFIQFTPNAALPNLTWGMGDLAGNVSLLVAPTSDSAQIGAFFMPGSNGIGILAWSNLNPYYNTVLLESSKNITLVTNTSSPNTWIFDNTGVLTLPITAGSGFSVIAAANSYPELLAYGSSGDGGPELDWMDADDPANTFNNVNTYRNTLYINSQGLYVGLNENGNANHYTGNLTLSSTNGDLTTPGNISTVGNINSNYLFGNGTFLTGISGAGNSSANALTGNTLTANVTLSSLTQVGTLGNLSVSGNATSGNLLTSGIISVTGNAIAGNILTAGVISSTGNAVHGNILTAGLISSTGNAIAGNILTGGFVSATGNIIATNFIGNLSNGNSKISIASSGNITVGIGPFDTTVLNINTSTGISVLGNVVASQAISAVGNVYSNGNIAMVSNLPRNTYVANVAPTSGDGNIGDIWYQTF